MNKEKKLIDLKHDYLDRIKNRQAISVFRNGMSLDGILEKAFVPPKLTLYKHNETCTGIDQVYRKYKDKNVCFIGEAGSGKTTSFLHLHIDSNNLYDTEFFYCFVPDLFGNTNSLNKYQKELRKVVKSGTGLNGILLLDGLEEQFSDNSTKASEFLKEIGESNITFWVSCRISFYQKLSVTIEQYFAETIELQLWKDGEYKDFFSLCLSDNKNREIITKRIDQVTKPIESLLERPLFATMILYIAELYDINGIRSEYELIGLFLEKWLQREQEKKRTSSEITYDKISNIALSLYSGKRPQYSDELRLFQDLLVLTGEKKGAIHGFYHREFLIYFIANAMLDAALNHPDQIVWWYSQTFYDDVTNMIKPALNDLDQNESRRIFDNLFSVYKRTYEEETSVKEEFERLKLLSNVSFLKLRDEVLYFIFRLPEADYHGFARYAYENSKDTLLFLGIAYGMARIDPNNLYTLEFAKKLTPNSPEDITNRGWGMCFFGDVEENGYEYTDSEGKPWTKIRNNRLNRLNSKEYKHIETRVLDIPLLYCFYSSRGFSDCTSYRDYCIIRDTDISCPVFGDEQKAFMSLQKSQLVSEYLKQLLFREIIRGASFTGTLHKEGLKMASDPNTISLEIDKKTAERILAHVKFKEDSLGNLKTFWATAGPAIVDKYIVQLVAPDVNRIEKEEFEDKIKNCKLLILSANSVEGAVVSQRLMQLSNNQKLDAWPYEGYLYQFASIDGIPTLHVWPPNTSSFTQYGSFSAVDTALDKFSPKYVIAVGVAFGADPTSQSLGDVLVSKEFVFYDNFNKVVDGEITLDRHEAYQIDPNLLAQLHRLEFPLYPEDPNVDPDSDYYKWYYGSMLTGGTVLSDADERNQLFDAAAKVGQKIIGGEMEASGIYYACQKIKGRHFPFLIIKGICDWGAEKNVWGTIAKNSKYSNDTIKDSIQAFACNHAFDVMLRVISQLNFSLSGDYTKPPKQLSEADQFRLNKLNGLLQNWHDYDSPYQGNSDGEIAARRLLNLFMDDKGRYDRIKPILDSDYRIVLDRKTTEGDKLLSKYVSATMEQNDTEIIWKQYVEFSKEFSDLLRGTINAQMDRILYGNPVQ